MHGRHIHRQLSLPTGTETLHLREMARHRRISRMLEDLFLAWGYAPVETPLVDYFEVFRPLLTESDIQQMYRAVDRQGEILALRSDTTTFLAKQLALHLVPEELPVRIFYNEQIVRVEDLHDISRNEYQQAGVELVGIAGTKGDAEILVLASEALEALGIADGVIHIGSHEVLNALREILPDEDEILELGKALRHRRFSDVTVDLLPAELPALLAFIGSADELEQLIPHSGPVGGSSFGQALFRLIETVRNVETLRPSGSRTQLRIDLSELGSHGYYTGIAFAAYLPRVNAAVLRGGRYDHLLGAFGIAAPSVGFSMFTRKLPPGILALEGVEADTDTRPVADRITAGRSLRYPGEEVHS